MYDRFVLVKAKVRCLLVGFEWVPGMEENKGSEDLKKDCEHLHFYNYILTDALNLPLPIQKLKNVSFKHWIKKNKEVQIHVDASFTASCSHVYVSLKVGEDFEHEKLNRLHTTPKTINQTSDPHILWYDHLEELYFQFVSSIKLCILKASTHNVLQRNSCILSNMINEHKFTIWQIRM